MPVQAQKKETKAMAKKKEMTPTEQALETKKRGARRLAVREKNAEAAATVATKE
jgi:hypothetical protein